MNLKDFVKTPRGLAVVILMSIMTGVFGNKLLTNISEKNKQEKLDKALADLEIDKLLSDLPDFEKDWKKFEAVYSKEIKDLEEKIAYYNDRMGYHSRMQDSKPLKRAWDKLNAEEKEKIISAVKKQRKYTTDESRPYTYIQVYYWLWSDRIIDKDEIVKLYENEIGNWTDDEHYHSRSWSENYDKRSNTESKRDSLVSSSAKIKEDLQLKQKKQTERNKQIADSVYLSKNLVRKK